MEPTGNPRGALHWAGFALAVALLAAHLVALTAPELLGSLATYRSDGALFLAGGPACLALMSVVALRWGRTAGACMLLGAAASAFGLSVDAGPRFLWYALGMAAWVLPQVAAGALLLLASRKPSAPKKARLRPKVPGA